MARYTISQLGAKSNSYTLLDSDLIVTSVGTATYDLSSIRVSLREYGDYLTTTYSVNNTFTIAGQISAMAGLSAVSPNDSLMIHLSGLPAASTNLQAGDLYTQTAAQLGGSGSVKVVCVAS